MNKKIEVYRSTDQNIVLVESVIVAIIVGVSLHYSYNIHPAICTVLGIIGSVIFNILFNTKIGFWIVTILFSLFWGIFFCGLGAIFYKDDNIWAIVVFGIATLISLSAHLAAKRYMDNVDD